MIMEKCKKYYNGKCHLPMSQACIYECICIEGRYKKINNSTQFTVPNPIMIDNEEINNSLSRKNPLLFLEYNNKIHVFVHRSIFWKATLFNIENTLPFDFESNLAPLKTKWVKWVKNIKSIKWGENKKETTVKMIFPKI